MTIEDPETYDCNILNYQGLYNHYTTGTVSGIVQPLYNRYGITPLFFLYMVAPEHLFVLLYLKIYMMSTQHCYNHIGKVKAASQVRGTVKPPRSDRIGDGMFGPC